MLSYFVYKALFTGMNLVDSAFLQSYKLSVGTYSQHIVV